LSINNHYTLNANEVRDPEEVLLALQLLHSDNKSMLFSPSPTILNNGQKCYCSRGWTIVHCEKKLEGIVCVCMCVCMCVCVCVCACIPVSPCVTIVLVVLPIWNPWCLLVLQCQGPPDERRGPVLQRRGTHTNSRIDRARAVPIKLVIGTIIRTIIHNQK